MIRITRAFRLKIIFLCCFAFVNYSFAKADGLPIEFQDTLSYNEYKGGIIDEKTKEPLVFASLVVANTNISTVTNSEGQFILKVPKVSGSDQIIVTFLGYQERWIKISELKEDENVIALTMLITELPEVMVGEANDPAVLVKNMLASIPENYLNYPTLMTAFYRETIKKRRRNVSLAEAVIRIHKEPYASSREDIISLYKARKRTDYERLDTLTLKLQGGPYNPLHLDLMKYPEYVFSDLFMSYYDFEMDKSTRINDKLVYVVRFKQKPNVVTPLYYGKLFIDAETYALVTGVYNLNVENRKVASDLLVRKKPGNAKVYPVEALYRVDYRQKNGKWYYGHSNVQLEFKINWKRRLFNSVFTLQSEMAVTNWKKEEGKENRPKGKERLKKTVIIPDEADGFLDPEFWGAYNLIEPEKSIEAAIRKISKKIERDKK
ncbi:carboxypeptidase-like regulatory domain-containing protein [Zhouia spongiae]|uniref:Carboxypeptidase-like regulatory domain-containing protein n=1 Tax=Zhouia spongiae TaxID=2202721 RepID=A0ABY3YJM4_9FLAO|nr:carboxypeptidase-like regulatory domain-containing protein [Zhouia spongiae]UNY98032.1 carboxypeptidase-like regulatory domain-containing protein [Zhouia spongiae]